MRPDFSNGAAINGKIERPHPHESSHDLSASLSVIIPRYNEAPTVVTLLRRHCGFAWDDPAVSRQVNSQASLQSSRNCRPAGEGSVDTRTRCCVVHGAPRYDCSPSEW
ncbi:MAG: hypothetical protein KatS3mg111_4003 [Pirellulaceae bacterium]|nr:MAG: hypothetical protein KatS3mg111_4003 [Pirellulaceae bacterium]